MKTTTINQISKLKDQVNSSNTANADGRQTVANCCKSLYNLIEEDVCKAGAEWMLSGMYNDLCNGNFAEPFLCERKKTTFLAIAKIYTDTVLPRLNNSAS